MSVYRRIIGAFLAAALILSAIFSLFGCDRTPEVKNRIFYEYFDTVSVIYDYSGSSEAEFDAVCLEIEELLDYYHRLFDIYTEGDYGIAKINAMAGKGEVECEAELVEFLEYCVELHRLTDGYVNVAMGAVLSIWHDYREAGLAKPASAAIPTEAELAEAAKHTDISNLVINKERSTVELTDEKMSLDVGAIGKGYATEKIAARLKEKGISGYVLDIGGNLRTVGTKPSGEGWFTGVKNPNVYSAEKYVYTFTLADGSAVTSGNYERFYTVEGKKYHHIIDKDTLLPAEGVTSVTVITESSALADGLSTALFCMDTERGRALVESLDGVWAVWVTDDGQIINTHKEN